MTQESGNKQAIKTVYVGTVVRAAPVRQGGEILKIDWPSKRIVNRRPVVPIDPTTDKDANPRGNSRGCRGIAVIGDQVVYANYHTITVADKDLTTNRTYTHPLFVGLHEIWAESPDCVWIAATAVDGAHALNLRTGVVERSIWPRMNVNIRNSLGVEKPTLDVDKDQRLAFLSDEHLKQKSHLHLNAVVRVDGRLIGLFNRYGALCDLENGDIVVRDDRIIGAHNMVAISATHCMVCDTKRAAILSVNLRAGRVTETIELREYSVVRNLKMAAEAEAARNNQSNDNVNAAIGRPLFVRGLAIKGDKVFVGLSPATVLEIDLLSQRLVSHVTFTHDPCICIHGLAIT